VHAPRLLRAAGHFLDKLPTPVVWVLCILLIVLVFVGDIETGGDIAWSIFYLLPVVIAAWALGWSAALVMVLTAGVAWLIADFETTPTYEHTWIRYWNGLVRSTFFFIVAYTLTQLRQALAHEHELARTDSLTGLANARSFYETATRELSRAQRAKVPLTVAYIDIDGFKRVNDTRGHLAGDALLHLIAVQLSAATREIDVVGRLGGDEFALLLPDVGSEGARVALTRITEDVMAAVDGWGIGLSIGVVTCRGKGLSLDDLIHRADALMYEAKKEGGHNARYVDIQA